MKADNTIKLLSRTKEYADQVIIEALKKMGVDGVVPSHGEIIATLFKQEELTMTDIASKISRDKSTVTTLVKKLIKAGILSTRPNENDKRSSYVYLTTKGRTLEQGFKDISEELYRIQYLDITEEERYIFRQVLIKMNLNFKNALGKE